MTNVRTMTSVALGLMLVAGLAACSTGQSGVSNRLGTITATLSASPQAVTEAGKETLEEMDLIIISSDATAVDGRVVARTARDDSVTIEVESAGDNVSDVGIRVGTFGDEAMSLTILEGIKQRLE